MENSRPEGCDLDLDEVISQIQSMREVTMHLRAAAITTLSNSPNDEVHRRRFVRLIEYFRANDFPRPGRWRDEQPEGTT
jgi:hypothetical protein